MAAMLRRAIFLGGPLSLGLAKARAEGGPVLRVARLRSPGASPRRPADSPPDLGQDLCQALSQVDPGLRFALTPWALSEVQVVQALARHELDLHWDLAATPRRREGLAFLDGPLLWRHRLQLVSAAQDLEDVPDLDALRVGAQRHDVVAVRDSVAAEFLASVPGLRWTPIDAEERPDAMLARGSRWALLPSHAQPALAHRSTGRTVPRTWRWQPTVFRDEAVHGAVSLAVPAPTRRRLVQALVHLERQGTLTALRAGHARA